MQLRSGVDLIETERLQQALERHGQRFLARIYTPAEQALCAGSPSSLAARFAAKEAVAKAFGTGIGQVTWTEIEILRDDQGAPVLVLHGKARELAITLGLAHWSLSLSHTREHAVAFVVALGG